MANLVSELTTIIQRTGFSADNQNLDAYFAAAALDIRNLVDHHNNVAFKLLEKLIILGVEPLDYGLVGNVISTHGTATEGSAIAYWNDVLGRPRSIKETIDVLLAEIARLEDIITGFEAPLPFDDSALISDIEDNRKNILQIARDAFGPTYTLEQNINGIRLYSLSQALDALGSFFTGFPGTGNTYTSVYPSLSLDISSVTDLADFLQNIRNYIGMPAPTAVMPVYSSTNIVTTGESLTDAISALDAAISAGGGNLQAAYDAGPDAVINTDNTIGAVTINGIEGLALENEATLSIEKSASAPSGEADKGKVFTSESAGITELHYVDSNDDDIQITRDSIVKELEIGKTWISPRDLVPINIDSPPETGSPPLSYFTISTDYAYEARVMLANFKTFIINTAVPVDENGNRPTKFNLSVITVSPGSAIGTIDYELDFPVRSGDILHALDGELLEFDSWQIVANATVNYSATNIVRTVSLGFNGDINSALGPGTPSPLSYLLQARVRVIDAIGDGDILVLGAVITWIR